MVSKYYKTASLRNDPASAWRRKNNDFFFQTVDHDNFIAGERELNNVRYLYHNYRPSQTVNEI